MNNELLDRMLAAAQKIDEGEYKDGYIECLQLQKSGIEKKQPTKSSDDFKAGFNDALNNNPPRGAHGNLMNTNAAKPESLDAQIVFRCKAEDKKKWKEEAKKSRISMGDWINRKLKE